MNLLQHLLELNISQDWNMEEFSKLSLDSKLIYADQRAKRIGSGSSRVAFEINYNGKLSVLKIAKNAQGINQNKTEIDILSDPQIKQLGILIPLFEYDNSTKPSWIHTGLATPLSGSMFFKIFKVDVATLIKAACNNAGYMHHPHISDDIIQMLLRNPYAKRIFKFFELKQPEMILDLMELDNWGIYEGRPVIIDIGLDQFTYA